MGNLHTASASASAAFTPATGATPSTLTALSFRSSGFRLEAAVGALPPGSSLQASSKTPEPPSLGSLPTAPRGPVAALSLALYGALLGGALGLAVASQAASVPVRVVSGPWSPSTPLRLWCLLPWPQRHQPHSLRPPQPHHCRPPRRPLRLRPLR